MDSVTLVTLSLQNSPWVIVSKAHCSHCHEKIQIHAYCDQQVTFHELKLRICAHRHIIHPQCERFCIYAVQGGCQLLISVCGALLDTVPIPISSQSEDERERKATMSGMKEEEALRKSRLISDFGMQRWHDLLPTEEGILPTLSRGAILHTGRSSVKQVHEWFMMSQTSSSVMCKGETCTFP